MIIAPSVLAADHGRLTDEIQAMEAAGADWIHFDVMDGRFVPNLAFGPGAVESARRITGLPLDVHLMLEDPLTYGPVYAKAGADYVVVHVEAARHLHRTLQAVREAGAKPGAALNPGTPLSALEPCLDMLELILLMGVNPGFGGQPYISATTKRAAQLAQLLAERGLTTPIEIDGGVTDRNAAELAAAGVGILVSGSHLFGAPDYAAAIDRLRRNADEGLVAGGRA
jgi:ribulose-phosphate 3-epimerase